MMVSKIAQNSFSRKLGKNLLTFLFSKEGEKIYKKNRIKISEHRLEVES